MRLKPLGLAVLAALCLTFESPLVLADAPVVAVASQPQAGLQKVTEVEAPATAHRGRSPPPACSPTGSAA